MTSRHQLPPEAVEFVATLSDSQKVCTRRLIAQLHSWLEVNPAPLSTDLVDELMKVPWAQQLAESTRRQYAGTLRRYVHWRNGTCARPRTELPTPARELIEELRATLSPETCRVYESALRGWHQWAESQQLDTYTLERQDVVAFCRMMHNRKLAPNTRIRLLVVLGHYLHHLHDQNLLAELPSRLLRRSDFPRKPRLLPRALRAEVDAELRERLAAASDIRCRGLLLMRHTGLRVGELARLELDCVREDNPAHHYLKVPLGKLKSERLVPLSDEALGLVRALQEDGCAGRQWLTENPKTRKPYTTTSYRNSLARLRDGLAKPDGLPITSHRLRHTFATEMLRGGMSLAAIRQLLGHRSINMTLRYVSLTPDQLRQDYLTATAKARERYGKVPEAPPTIQHDERTSAETIDDVVRQIKRDAAELSTEKKARARRAARQLKNLGILLDELGI